MSEINKDELQVMVQVITRNTEQLAILVERFSQQTSKIEAVQTQQEKTNARLYNGMAKEISSNVIDVLKDCNHACGESHKDLATAVGTLKGAIQDVVKTEVAAALEAAPVSKDMGFLKILVASITTVVVIAGVILMVLDGRQNDATLKNKATTVIQTVTNTGK